MEELLLYCKRKGCSRLRVLLLTLKAKPNTGPEDISAIVRDVIDVFHNHDNLIAVIAAWQEETNNP